MLPRISRRKLERELEIRTPLYHPEFPVIVMWSEKSACTVAVKWFFHHLGLLDEALACSPWVHIYENEVFKAREGYVADCASAILSGKPVVKIVRNPYLRAVSGFLETCNARILQEPDHWSAQTRSAILNGLFRTVGELEYAYSFNQFARWLGAEPAEQLDPHLAPQYVPVESLIKVETIRLEDYDAPFAALEQRFGLTSTLGDKRIYSSGHHHRKRSVAAGKARLLMDAGLPLQRRKTFRLFDFPVKVIANASAGQAIRTVYAQDFSVYGYDLMGQETP